MKRWRFLLAAVAILGVSGVASGATFWDDFEAYAAGSNLVGQAGWKGFDNDTGYTGVVSTKHAFSGANSVEILASTAQVHEFKLVGGRYIFTIQQYIPSGGYGMTYFILHSKYRDGGYSGYDEWAVQTSFNMTTGVLNSEIGGRIGTIIYDKWVELKYVIDLVENTVQEYYAGELIASYPWSSSVSGTFQAIDLYGNGAYPVYYDDIKIEPIYVYEASMPNPADGAIGVTTPALRWTAGDGAVLHDVYLGTRPELTAANKVSVHTTLAMYSHKPGFQPGTTYYWRVDEFERSGPVHPGKVWSFTSAPLMAFRPGPADGSEGAPTVPVLTWSLPLNASESRVYFSDDIDTVKNGDASADKGMTSETNSRTGLLRAGTGYFWRVDVTNDTGEIVTGPIWNFTTLNPVVGKVVREWWLNILLGATVRDLTTDLRYPANPTDREFVDLWEGPVDWDNYYGSRLYGWIKPPATGDYTFWIASDDASELWLSTDDDPANGRLIASVSGWVGSRDFDNATGYGGANQKSAAVILEAGNLYFMQVLMKDGWGGDNIAVAWQPPGSSRDVIPGSVTQTFILPPLKAAAPSPRNGAIDVVQTPVLSWYAGENAQSHQVYFGDNAEAVTGADTSSVLYRGEQTATTFEPGDLESGRTYFWRVDEVTPDSDKPLTGTVWRFTTAN